jgi:hypothetical protein
MIQTLRRLAFGQRKILDDLINKRYNLLSNTIRGGVMKPKHTHKKAKSRRVVKLKNASRSRQLPIKLEYAKPYWYRDPEDDMKL